MLKPRPLYPGPRPPYVDALVKILSEELDAHVRSRNDPHATLLNVPIVYAGSGTPGSDDRYKNTDLYIDLSSGILYRRQSDAWAPVNLGGSAKPMSGRRFRLDDDNDVYTALQAVLENLGAEVI